mmetsp:Transcript_73155/g.169672  ORF Transcript_73155/g.169672 Transcript_73155/m.169672 type:complete len:217 (+) Transcript_73155:1744-2394(+)
MEHLRLELKLRHDHLVCVVPSDDTLIDIDVNDVAHVHLLDVHLDGQSPGVLTSVEEDRRNHPAQHVTPCALVRDVGDVFTHVPQDGVCRRLARRASTNDVTDVNEGEALLLELGYLLGRVGDAVPWELQHGQSVQGDIWPGEGIRSRREVVRVGLAGDFEHGERDLLGELRPGGEPFGSSPRLHDLFGICVACLLLVLNVVECVEHQQGLGQALHC